MALTRKKAMKRGGGFKTGRGSARPLASKPIPRKSPMRKRPKSASKFRAQYGSKERVAFVKSLPCAACGVVGYSENAHVGRRSGMGLKGTATEIAPLCGPWGDWTGCHRYLHAHGDALLDVMSRGVTGRPLNLEEAAANCEQAWQAELSRRGATKD